MGPHTLRTDHSVKRLDLLLLCLRELECLENLTDLCCTISPLWLTSCPQPSW